MPMQNEIQHQIQVQGLTPLLQVFDMRAAIAFYRDVLGFEVRDRSKALSDDADDVNWAMLELGGTTVMLNTAYEPELRPERPEAARWAGHGDACLYFGCQDVDAVYAHLKAKGLDVNPPKMAWYGMKQLYVKDPDGFLICFQRRT